MVVLRRTDFKQFLYWEGVVILKELILNSFYIRKVWWSWKNWFWSVSILRCCVGLERIDFEQFLIGRVSILGGCGLERPDFSQFLRNIRKVCWSWKNWFLSVSVLRCCVGLERTDFNSFYIRKVWWSWKNWFFTVSILGRYGGLERIDFKQFLYWEGVVILKELILNSFYIRKVWWSWKNWFWTVSILRGSVGLERSDFSTVCLYWEAVVVLKELIFHSFYIRKVCWSWKNWFLTVCLYSEGYGDLKRIDFEQFPLWVDAVLKEYF